MSCISDEGDETQEVVQFSDLGDDLSFSLTSCVADDADGINRDEFMEVSQVDVMSGLSSADVESRILNLGLKVRAFYQVPETLDKPVGVRRYPHKNSPRTGDAYFPGEVIETVQEIVIDGTKFVRAVGGSAGWLFVTHPSLDKQMLDYIPGEIIEAHKSYMYKVNQPTPIGILSGPHENCQKTSHVIFPGEEIDISETWKPSDGSGKTYIKLIDKRGWVELTHPISNEDLFDELVT
eukprot:CAMPEP_0185032740 /NCGR_PEP_ID=MMETSP1103-20130426/21083_1 /TAXON_ID=36769 /ORGANISM="Paraphysomonas bandaiensis, Strain Caron Lab Isolate" /LENGTH=235 /DNA_ID=CAMNT_0027568737 /DNA_START=45 /DNA_END=752 /DNA_ORIENTATION=+